ncbi:hypothetical protein O1611_g10619 [Lasiodiplodia mahajangana]|uniref:Uncharacterized protein n=1 Tax=Lasiodiplodia mahajangana TaxID=1108764 RepID=A0ACC2IW61_9PEZI|nr:hypothetical protein O1611_g10619 [Lasiodiplodia mahajangana]
MAISAPTTAVRGNVTAKLNFTRPLAEGQLAFNYVDTPPAGEPQNNLEKTSEEVEITDIRGHPGCARVKGEGLRRRRVHQGKLLPGGRAAAPGQHPGEQPHFPLRPHHPPRRP